MGRAGLCTIALKTKPLSEALTVAADVGASAVEVWGQPPHVAYPIDRSALEATRRQADELGLEIVALGSYFQPGKEVAFEGIVVDAANQIEIASLLGAELIRIWAGAKGYHEVNPEERNAIYDEIRSFADAAAEKKLRVVLERHIGTLTHGWDAPERVLADISHPNVSLNYQIAYPESAGDYTAKSIRDYTRLLPKSHHAHIQNYMETTGGKLTRTFVDRGVIDYARLGTVAKSCGYPGYFMIEFPADLRSGMTIPEALAADVDYLNSL